MADIVAAPSASFEATFAAGETGLVGTVKLGIYNGVGGVTQALATTGIVETPAGSGIYVATRTAPATGGQYVLVWSLDGTTDPDQVFVDQLLVTYSAPAAASPSGRDLCTLEDVLAYAPGYELGDDTDLESKLQQLITAQSTLIMAETGREIVTAGNSDPRVFDIDRTAAITGCVPIDDLSVIDGDTVVAVYDQTGALVETVDNDTLIVKYGGARQAGEPWEPIDELEFRTARGAPNLFPGHEIRITGAWGFPEIPAFIREACAARVLLRYVSDVAETGTPFADAVEAGNINLAGLFASSQESINQIKQVVFA